MTKHSIANRLINERIETHLGETGLDKTWQEPFDKTTECVRCKGEARIAFVAQEPGGVFHEDGTVSSLHRNDPNGEGYWPHDAVAVGVYFCRECLEPTAKFNQA